MRRLVFVDSSAWIAAFADRDERHSRSAGAMTRLLEEGKRFVTTDYVFDETVTRLRYTSGHAQAVNVGEHLLASRVTRVDEVSKKVRVRAWEIFKKCGDQKFSFTDCTSFATMEKLGIQEALSFDDDFRKMGFLTLPRA